MGPHLQLLVFDLDGTLIDSRADLVASVNAMLAWMGRPLLPDEQIAGYVGDGAPVLVARVLGASAPPTEADVAEGLAFFLDYYRAHKLDRTTLYAGVEETLEALASGYRMAVLTNKPVGPSRGILEGLGVADYFSAIYGGDSFPWKKPDPVGLRALLAEHSLPAAAALMVGDSPVDVATGRAAGSRTCACTYGLVAPERLLAAPADFTIDCFAQLAERLAAAATEDQRNGA